MNDEACFQLKKNLIVRKKEGTLLILNKEKSAILQFDGVALFIFMELKNKIKLVDLVNKICNEYDVNFNQAKKDTEDWLQQAIKEGIIIQI